MIFHLNGLNCFENVFMYLTVLFTVEQDIQTVWDGGSHGQSKRWTLHSHRPV